MIRLFWVLAWTAVAVWSLFALAAYGLIDLFGGLAARNADSFATDPNAVEWLFRVLNGLRNVGLAAVLIVWGAVSLAILAVPFALSRLARMQQPPPEPRPNTQIVYPPRPGARPVEMRRDEPPGRPLPPR